MKRISLAIAAVLLLGAAIYSPASDYLQARQADRLIRALRDPYEDVPSLLKRVDDLNPPIQAWVLDQARPAVIKYFELRAESAIDSDKGHHDFDSALAGLHAVDIYYPDSAELEEEKLSILNRKYAYCANAAADKPRCSPEHKPIQ